MYKKKYGICAYICFLMIQQDVKCTFEWPRERMGAQKEMHTFIQRHEKGRGREGRIEKKLTRQLFVLMSKVAQL